jgi:coenzyme F420 hydrogenase subunit beta
MSSIKTINDIVAWRMCIGCGVCAYICPRQKISLWDFPHEGIRPVADTTDCGSCTECLQACPVVETDFASLPPGDTPAVGNAEFKRDWGQVLEIWEGHAADPDIRFQGSSGGILTALGAYCVEKGDMDGVLHIGAHPRDPLRNQGRLSRTKSELLAATGSRYSPAAAAARLDLVEKSERPCAVIGKPGDISAVRRAEGLRPALRSKIGLTMSFFCAETPATNGTHELLRKLGVTPERVTALRYRGLGWPGHFAPVCAPGAEPVARMPYRESWAFLQRFRPWSIHLWPDGSGELADITCGDPWYEEPDGTNPGFSIVAVRTERGRRILREAMAAGYVALTPAEPWKLSRSQPILAEKKHSVWGRQMALRCFGLPVTRYRGLDQFKNWMSLPLKTRFRSFLSTVRRMVTRKLYRPLKLDRQGAFEVGKD